MPIHLHETAALYYSLVSLLIGAQLLALGFVAELISALMSKESDAYSVAQHTSPDKTSSDSTSSAPPHRLKSES